MKRLMECVGTDNSFQDIGISRQRYEVDSAVFAWDVEALSGAVGSGYNMSHGQLLRVHFAGVGDGVDAHHATRAYCALHHDVILELSASGAIVHT